MTVTEQESRVKRMTVTEQARSPRAARTRPTRALEVVGGRHRATLCAKLTGPCKVDGRVFGLTFAIKLSEYIQIFLTSYYSQATLEVTQGQILIQSPTNATFRMLPSAGSICMGVD